MTIEEIKLRRLTNQYLVTPADKMTVVRDLCGIQSQFFPNVLQALKIRCADCCEEAIGEGLVKNWTLRGTVHVFAEADIPVFLHCRNGLDYRRNQWDTPSFWNQRTDWALTPQRQQFFSDVILQELEAGPLTRDALKQRCREQGMTAAEEGSMFHPWGGGIRQLCERGFLHYAAQEEKCFCLTPVFTPIPEETAKLELARRYFENFGPATIHDAMYFFKTSASQVKLWLTQLPVTACQADGKTYYYIENGKTYGAECPECLYLAGFDQLMLGYEKKESLYLNPEHLRQIFNLAGIVMPPLLLNGEVAGTWKRKNGILTVQPFRHLSDREIAILKTGAERLWDTIKKVEIKA